MKGNIQKQIQKTLSKDTACYVIITCESPSADGDMQVEMSYEGDAALASYLLQGAQSYLDEQVDDQLEGSSPIRIIE